MPIVRVSMFEGRSLEKKRALIRGITDVVARVCEVSPEGVHVLIDEMTRENWGRGGIPNVDRLPSTTTAGFFSVSTIQVAPERADEYLAYRRDAVNPAMAPMAGFQASVLARDLEDPSRLLLFNGWGQEADWRAYQATDAHDALRKTIRSELVKTMEIKRYRRVDLPNGGGLDAAPTTSRHMTVSTHRVRPERVADYLELRRQAVNPGMAALEGFCSTTILEDLDTEADLLIVNQWLSREASEAYSHSSLHDDLRVRVRALLDRHSGTRQYETVPL